MHRLLSHLMSVLAATGLAAYILLGSGSTAQARMSLKDWKAAEKQFHERFGSRGNAPRRVEIMATIAGDGSARAWRLMAEGLYLETQLWSQIQAELTKATAEHRVILARSSKGYTNDDAQLAKDLQTRLEELEREAKAEQEAYASIVALVSKGSKDLRKFILKRAKPDCEWPYRAAALRVAASTLSEKPSSKHARKYLAKDEDARVRLAGLEALAQAPEGWEDHVLGRLADPDDSVVLTAARILGQRDLKRAVPQLIEALPGASPRVAHCLSEVLQALTEKSTGPDADAWHKWREEHKGTFAGTRICGVPIRSNRVLFVLDRSGAMGKPPKDDKPGKHWKPDPPVADQKSPPADRLDGTGIDIAKHELKLAIRKLPADSTFNIIAFNQAAAFWERTMVTATDRHKESAYRWIQALEPRGVSYVDGALRLGFRMAGVLDFGAAPSQLAADTLVLLSVGGTTDNALPVAKPMAPEVVLAHVRAWNRRKLVVLHCVGFEPSEYMKKLASENGGVYVE